MDIKDYLNLKSRLNHNLTNDDIDNRNWHKNNDTVLFLGLKCSKCGYTEKLQYHNTTSNEIFEKDFSELKQKISLWFCSNDGKFLCPKCYNDFMFKKSEEKRKHCCLWCEYSWIEEDVLKCYLHQKQVLCSECCDDYIKAHRDKDHAKQEELRENFYKEHCNKSDD